MNVIPKKNNEGHCEHWPQSGKTKNKEKKNERQISDRAKATQNLFFFNANEFDEKKEKNVLFTKCMQF